MCTQGHTPCMGLEVVESRTHKPTDPQLGVQIARQLSRNLTTILKVDQNFGQKLTKMSDFLAGYGIP